MKKSWRNIFIYIVALVFLAAVAGKFAAIFSSRDEVNIKIIGLLRESQVVKKEVGEIYDVVLERRVIFDGDREREPYRVYTYSVDGRLRIATVKIKVVNDRYGDMKIIEIR